MVDIFSEIKDISGRFMYDTENGYYVPKRQYLFYANFI